MRSQILLCTVIAFLLAPMKMALADKAAIVPYVQDDCGSLMFFSGAEVVGGSNGSWESYTGGIYALNRDLCKRGVLLRAMLAYGEYEYEVFDDTLTPAVTPIDGENVQGDLMIGYQVVGSRFDVAIYLGVEFADHDLTPDDPENPVNGSETSFKVAADIEANDQQKIYYLVEGSYSTEFESYYALGQLGINFNRFVVGVEGWALGDDSFEANRVGGFMRFDANMIGSHPTQFVLSVGHQNDETGGDTSRSEGTYGTFHTRITF